MRLRLALLCCAAAGNRSPYRRRVNDSTFLGRNVSDSLATDFRPGRKFARR
jgi:hypothetical protein